MLNMELDKQMTKHDELRRTRTKVETDFSWSNALTDNYLAKS
jgi:hypothetical protein